MRPISLLLIATAILLCGMGKTRVSATTSKTATAQTTLQIELNAFQQRPNACRVSFVATNKMKQNLASLVLELVVFKTDGKVSRLLSASFGDMPQSKTRLKQYDIPNLACDKIGSILLNEVTVCKGKGLTAKLCTAATQTSSRVKIPFNF